ncbi:hypothetical protein L484_022654 [Morus notabilis]|uniref:Uncharacterized protein n=1 Tax=Morus notabilis TaxID=981085 RepID=W9R5Q4_9ROSA|nr:uncharacterized protein LOC21405464 [Morus notabilis]EXB57548.1 hypothetical protein L484_022654 [Morus notabilis]
MGGNNNSSRQKKGSSFFSLFRFKRNRRVDDYAVEDMRRVWPSDEDRGRWVAEPGIDRKAEAFIAKIHKNMNTATDFERKTITIPTAAAAASKA